MKKFEVGKTYIVPTYYDDNLNEYVKEKFKCVRRTEKYVTFEDIHGRVQRRKVINYNEAYEEIKYDCITIIKADQVEEPKKETKREELKEQFTIVKKGKKRDKNCNKMIRSIYEYSIFTEVEENGKEIVKNIVKGNKKIKAYPYKINKNGILEKFTDKITFTALKSGIYAGRYIIS